MAWAILSCYKGGEGEAAFSRRLLDDSGGFALGDASAAVIDFAAERRAALRWLGAWFEEIGFAPPKIRLGGEPGAVSWV